MARFVLWDMGSPSCSPSGSFSAFPGRLVACRATFRRFTEARNSPADSLKGKIPAIWSQIVANYVIDHVICVVDEEKSVIDHEIYVINDAPNVNDDEMCVINVAASVVDDVFFVINDLKCVIADVILVSKCQPNLPLSIHVAAIPLRVLQLGDVGGGFFGSLAAFSFDDLMEGFVHIDGHA